MEKLKPSYTPDILRLLDPKNTKEDDWSFYWKGQNLTKEFPFPNIVLAVLSGKDQFPEETKISFGSALHSFMQTPSGGKDGLVGSSRMFMVNKETQLWEYAKDRKRPLDQEPLIRLAIGSLVLWGLSLKEQNTILESYFNLKELNTTSTKIENFRSNIFQLMTVRNPFRQWVLGNKFDKDNDFEWDTDVPLLGFSLIPLRDSTNHKNNNNVPTEFNALDTYAPSVIETFLQCILNNQERFPSGRIQKLITDVKENMRTRDDFKSNSDLVDTMNKTISQLENALNIIN